MTTISLHNHLLSIDALAKAAAITKKSINKKNRKLPTSEVVKQFAFASLPDDIMANFTNQIITQTNINQRIKIFLSYYPPRFLALFLLGSLASFVVDHLLTQNNITQYPKDIAKLIDTAAWIPLTCGFSAVLVGSLFPLADYLFMYKPNEFQREWSNVMRCIGGFIGVAYAATKLPWSSNYQVSCTLALISIVLWFLFDRTKHGFIMSTLFSSIGTIVMYILVSNGIYSFTHADFFGVRSWIPCILYSSCVCFGAVGRQLMIVPEEWFEDDDVNTISNTFSNSINNTVNNNIRNNNNKTDLIPNKD
nr:9292_t:CDS:2 [Entrophospora candida]